MDDFIKDLEKVIKAGIGAVAAGMEKAQDAVDKLAQKVPTSTATVTGTSTSAACTTSCT